jgi:hypothetical protein
MPELKELHDKAIGAAMNAAFAVAESETWFIGGAAPTNKAGKAWAKHRLDWLHFARENHLAPAEALWIKGGALGLHDGKTSFADLPALIRLAFETFQRVFLQISDALDEAARQEAARIAAEERAAELAARPPVKPDHEGTPLEQHEDPLAPSEFARAPAKAATDGAAS